MIDKDDEREAPRIGKNIVICSDGTGNTVMKGRGTNVFKTFEAIDLSGHLDDPDLTEQRAFYDDGVGTERIAPLRALGGAFGWGLARNVRQLYRSLSRCYEDGDRIYMFGFSRGAFTVRTLVGLITDCGLIDVKKANVKGLPFLTPGSDTWLRWVAWRAWRSHRWHYRAVLEAIILAPFKADARTAVGKFRAKYSRDRNDDSKLPRIHFIGVWDTVGAVAIPFNVLRAFLNTFIYRFSFPSNRIAPQVEKACHALAIDEERHAFFPVLWDETGVGTVGDCRCGAVFPGDAAEAPERQEERRAEPCVEQVWFPGVHSNIGGGYPKQGISLVALDWMMAKAEAHGLRFTPLARARVHQQRNIHDHMYDSRRGVSRYYFYKPRDIAELVTKRKTDPVESDYADKMFGGLRFMFAKMMAGRETNAALRIHASAFDRAKAGTGGYAPGPIPSNLTVVDTPGEERADNANVQAKVASAKQPEQTRLVRARMVLQVALYFITALAVVVGWWRLGSFEALWEEVWSRRGDPVSIITDAARAAPIVAGLFATSLLLTWGVSRAARAKINARRTEYWRETLG